VVNAAGVVQRNVLIDFDAQTFSVDGGAATPYSPVSFQADLQGVLGASATVGFAGGALTLSAANPGDGLVLAEDPAAPSNKAGRTFGQYFGLNDLIRTTGFASYDTGLTLPDQHGFTAGGQVRLRIQDSTGQRLRDVTVTIPVAGTMQDLVDTMNDPATGVGLYGQFGLDAAGALSYGGLNSNGSSISVVSDTSERGPGGVSVTELFGIGPAERSNRASRFAVAAAIHQNPMRLALATLNLAATPPTAALTVGDGSGAIALAQSGDRPTGFSAAGDFGAVTMSLIRYGAEFGGDVGRKAAAADTTRLAADAVQTEAENRRQAVEGVNLDEELVNMTTYQQAFNASARVIQAAQDLYDTLIGMMA
jgi:flagellar hook-associated protein 1 FlgK